MNSKVRHDVKLRVRRFHFQTSPLAGVHEVSQQFKVVNRPLTQHSRLTVKTGDLILIFKISHARQPRGHETRFSVPYDERDEKKNDQAFQNPVKTKGCSSHRRLKPQKGSSFRNRKAISLLPPPGVRSFVQASLPSSLTCSLSAENTHKVVRQENQSASRAVPNPGPVCI